MMTGAESSGCLGVNFEKEIDIGGDCNDRRNVGVHGNGNGKFGCDDSSYESVKVIVDDHADKGFPTTSIVLGSAIQKDAGVELLKEEGSTVDVGPGLQINGPVNSQVVVVDDTGKDLCLEAEKPWETETINHPNKESVVLNDLQGDTSDSNVTSQGVKSMDDLQSCGISMSSASEVPDDQTEEADNELLRTIQGFKEKLREQIKNTLPEFDKKTRCKDALMAEIEGITARLNAFNEAFIAEYLGKGAVRRSDGQETGSMDCVINKVKNGIAVEETDSRKYKAGHTRKHETSKEDMKCLHLFKQLITIRDRHASNIRSQNEIKQALDKKDQVVSQLAEVSVDKTETGIQLKESAENLEVRPATVELDVNLQNLKKGNVEMIKDSKEPQVVVMKDIQNALCPVDDKAQSANEADKPLETETINDPITKESIVSQFVEVSIDKTETDVQLKGSPENIQVCPASESSKSEDDNGEVFTEKDLVSHSNPSDSALLDQQVEDGVPPVPKNRSLKGMDLGTEIENPDVPNDKQTEFEVKEAPVRGHSLVSFPDTFLNPGIKIQFGSFGCNEEAPSRHPGDINVMLEVSNKKTEPTCGANSNKPDMIPNDLPGDKSDGNVTCQGVKCMDVLQSDRIDMSSMESSVSELIDAQTKQAEVSPYNWVIRVPRFEDEKLREQIKSAQQQLDEKTRCRDAIRDEIQVTKARLKAHNEASNAANLELVAARRLVRLKRQEIDSINCVLNRVKNAIAVKDADSRIHNAEHMIKHETLSLKDEKKFIHEITHLKIIRDQLASNMGSQDGIQQSLDKKDEIEENLKKLKKELNSLKDKVSKAEAPALANRKTYEEENKKGKELQAQFAAAAEVRQEAYEHLNSLKKHLYDKKMFHKYKEDVMAARNLASCGDKAAVHLLCANQVKRFMEEWNMNGEFRKDYTSACSMSANRRHNALHEPFARSLVPIPGETKSISVVSTVEERKMVSSVEEKHSDTQTMQKQNVASVEEKHADMQKQKGSSVEEKHSDTQTMHKQKVASVEKDHSDTRSILKVAETNNKSREVAKPVVGSNSRMSSGRNEIRDDNEEEEEKLKEQNRLEEKKKASEAMERTKRNAEKAQMRAELQAQKEAEQKQKAREKRLRKKERKRAGSTTTAINGEDDEEKEIETTTDKKAQHHPPPSHLLSKQLKPKCTPLPPALASAIRNRRRWQWWKTATFVTLLLLLLPLVLFNKTDFFR